MSYRILKNNQELVLNSTEKKKLEKELKEAVGGTTINIAYLQKDITSVLDPKTGRKQLKVPGGRSIYLVGKDPQGNTIQLFETAVPNQINPQIVEYTPNTYNMSVPKQTIDDVALAWFFVFCCPYVENNHINEKDRRISQIELIDENRNANNLLFQARRKRQLEDMIQITNEDPVEKKLLLLNIAKAINIPGIDEAFPTTTTGSGAKAKTKVGGNIELLSVEIMNKIGTLTPAKVGKYLKMFSVNNPELMIYIKLREAEDKREVSFERKDSETILWKMNDEGLKVEKILEGIPNSDPDPRPFTVSKINTDESVQKRFGIDLS